MKTREKQIGKYKFKVESKYASGSGEDIYHKTLIQKREGGGWGIPIIIVYFTSTEILWFKKEEKMDEQEIMIQLKVNIELVESIIDSFINANNIEVL
jgi:hypothetical protein